MRPGCCAPSAPSPLSTACVGVCGRRIAAYHTPLAQVMLGAAVGEAHKEARAIDAVEGPRTATRAQKLAYLQPVEQDGGHRDPLLYAGGGLTSSSALCTSYACCACIAMSLRLCGPWGSFGCLVAAPTCVRISQYHPVCQYEPLL